jgi:hypothetical protein
MRFRLFTIFSSLSFVFSFPVLAQESNPAPPATTKTSVSLYPDSTDGLRGFLNSLAAAIQKNDAEESARIAQTIVLEDLGLVHERFRRRLRWADREPL